MLIFFVFYIIFTAFYWVTIEMRIFRRPHRGPGSHQKLFGRVLARSAGFGFWGGSVDAGIFRTRHMYKLPVDSHDFPLHFLSIAFIWFPLHCIIIMFRCFPGIFILFVFSQSDFIFFISHWFHYISFYFVGFILYAIQFNPDLM